MSSGTKKRFGVADFSALRTCAAILLIAGLVPILHAQDYKGRVHFSGVSTGKYTNGSEVNSSKENGSWDLREELEGQIDLHALPSLEEPLTARQALGTVRGTYKLQGRRTELTKNYKSGQSINCVKTITIDSGDGRILPPSEITEVSESAAYAKKVIYQVLLYNTDTGFKGSLLVIFRYHKKVTTTCGESNKEETEVAVRVLPMGSPNPSLMGGGIPWPPNIVDSVPYRYVQHPSASKAINGTGIEIPFNLGVYGDDTGEGQFDLALTADCRIQFQTQTGADLSSVLRIGVKSGSADRIQHLRAVAKSTAEIKNVKLSTSPTIRILRSTINGNAIDFDVIGVNKSATRGDSKITATYSDQSCTQFVSVVVPDRIGSAHNTDGPLIVSNMAVGEKTSPAATDLPKIGRPPGFVRLGTFYGKFLTVTVQDKFCDPVGDLYEGARVTESGGVPYKDFDLAGLLINQTLSASSTYSDPVGAYVGLKQVVLADSAQAKAWVGPSTAPLSLTELSLTGPETYTQNIPVQVDGFPLNPGIVNRIVTITPPNMVTITWPALTSECAP